jgi:hypothetical protein
MLQSWIDKTRKALEGDDKPLKQRIIQQSVEKIVLKQKTVRLRCAFSFMQIYVWFTKLMDLRDGNPITKYNHTSHEGSAPMMDKTRWGMV